jgi:copper chaperone NosL
MGTQEKRNRRLVMAASALILLLVYVLPIWSISLKAPQYPEGIGLNIKINNIEGKHFHNLESINGLNHYIGMKPINPNSIPELKLMPPIFAVLIILGLFAAWMDKSKIYFTWLGLFILLALVGLADFWYWEYDYGHDLNPHAPIKVPGMSYQPPLLGTKQLLNMRTTSLPHIGFFVALISMGGGAWAWWKSRDQK